MNLSKKLSLKEAGEEAYRIMLRGVWALERGGQYTLAEAEAEVKKLATDNGLKFEDVEAAAQKLSTKKGA